jgi:hypothetical protein
MNMPFCYFYDNPYAAYRHAIELIEAGFDAGTTYWEGSGSWMVTFDCYR